MKFKDLKSEAEIIVQTLQSELLKECWKRTTDGYLVCLFYDRFICNENCSGYCSILERFVTKKSECSKYDFTKRLMEIT